MCGHVHVYRAYQLSFLHSTHFSIPLGAYLIAVVVVVAVFDPFGWARCDFVLSSALGC